MDIDRISLRDAAQQALNALTKASIPLQGHYPEWNDAISSLRAALRAEEMCACKDRPKARCPGEWEPGCDLGANEQFVAVAQQERKPLTDEQIIELKKNTPLLQPERRWGQTLAFARAIERAHGIKP